jgi:hypothetical protein
MGGLAKVGSDIHLERWRMLPVSAIRGAGGVLVKCW